MRKGFYKRLIKELDNTCSPLCPSDLFSYYAHFNSILVFRITNETLAHTMYLAIKQNVYDTALFNNMKFITLDKQEKVVFVVCDRGGNKSKILELIDIADSFSKMLSCNENKIYVNYFSLFSDFATQDFPNLGVCLMSAITLKESTLTLERIELILNYVLKVYKNEDDFYFIKSCFKDEFNSFFAWFKKGLLLDSTPYTNTRMPLAMYVNIFKYAMDNTSFSDIHELFVLNEQYNEINKTLECVIIDEERFMASLKQTGENDEFIFFEDTEGNIFAKFKYDDDSSSLARIINCLNRECLVLNSKIVRSTKGDVYLFINSSSKDISLKEYINSIKGNDEQFISFIKNLYAWISEEMSFDDLEFQPGTDFLSCMCYLENIQSVPFIELSNFAITTDGELFNCNLVLMMAIAEYVSCSQIPIEQLPFREFSKVLHPSFIALTKRFIECGEVYKCEEDKIFSGCNACDVEFVENLPANSAELLSKLSFFNDVNLPEKLALALDTQKKADMSNGYLSLDCYLDFIKSRDVSNIDSILSSVEDEYKQYFLTPEKIIISHTPDIYGNYQIVGVLWNHSLLNNACEVVKSKKLTCKQVYEFISNLFYAYVVNGLNIDLPYIYDNLLIETSTMDFVLTPEVDEWYEPKYRRQYEDYYAALMDFLVKYADFSKNYELFEFEELTGDFYADNSAHINFKKQVQGMKLCKEHNHWHLADSLCPQCKKFYRLINLKRLPNPAYEDSIGRFFLLDDEEIAALHKFSADNICQYIKQVKLGIENSLYDKFFMIRPMFIVLEKDRRQPIGIEFASTCLLEDIVKLDTFKHTQRLKAILLIYQKLLPYILDGSFISTDQRIFDTIVMHKDCKGEISVPNLPLLDCATILSKDQNFKASKIEETKKVFANFLSEYLISDEYLATMLSSKVEEFVDILEDIKQLKFSPLVIKYCLSHYTNYCKTHMAPYSNKAKLCPLCKKDGIPVSKVVFKPQKYFDGLKDENSDFDGGEANIYIDPSNPNEALKIFKSTVDLGFKSKILAKALKKSKLIDGFNMEHQDIQIISANKLYYQLEQNTLQLKGFTQNFVQDSFKISNLKDKIFVKEHGYSRMDIVEILIKVCKGIQFIHSIGGFIGDLNGGNILIKGKSVYIIDIDGMSFDNVKNCVYTNLYIYPPSAQENNITKEDDWYSLAVQAFYYLTYSHPFRGICNNKKVPANEAERMTLGLSVLGNHGIVPPSISIGWNFIPKDLLKYFMDTFEDKRRENMLDMLQAYYEELKKMQQINFSLITRNKPVSKEVCEHVYFDDEDNLIVRERVVKNAAHWQNFFYCESNKTLLLSFEDCAWLVNIGEDTLLVLPKTYEYSIGLSICDGNIYYTSEDKQTLLVDTISYSGDPITTHTIRKATSNPIVSLCVEEKDKFVFVEDNKENNSLDVYCNSIMVYSLSKDSLSDYITANIEYDVKSKNWLVVFKSQNKAIGIVIERDSGRISQFEISQTLGYNLCFYGNTLYYANDGKICYYNISKDVLKEMECDFATIKSPIYRYGNKFIVVNSTKAYMYEKS